MHLQHAHAQNKQQNRYTYSQKFIALEQPRGKIATLRSDRVMVLLAEDVGYRTYRQHHDQAQVSLRAKVRRATLVAVVKRAWELRARLSRCGSIISRHKRLTS